MGESRECPIGFKLNEKGICVPMGEFEKRWKEVKDRIETRPNDSAIDCHADKLVIWTNMLKIVAEAKKEFPFKYFTEEGDPVILNQHELWKQVLACVDWFVKWFGDEK